LRRYARFNKQFLARLSKREKGFHIPHSRSLLHILPEDFSLGSGGLTEHRTVSRDAVAAGKWHRDLKSIRSFFNIEFSGAHQNPKGIWEKPGMAPTDMTPSLDVQGPRGQAGVTIRQVVTALHRVSFEQSLRAGAAEEPRTG